ncbi:hypothetical protein GCM10027443_22880 [Pontibacter brevis]
MAAGVEVDRAVVPTEAIAMLLGYPKGVLGGDHVKVVPFKALPPFQLGLLLEVNLADMGKQLTKQPLPWERLR